jgi:hypothetical protein
VQQVAGGGGVVSEAITLRVRGDDPDNVAANLQALDDKIKETAWFFNETTEQYACWLHCKLDNETNARRALIRGLAGSIGENLYQKPMSPGNVIRTYTLAIDRYPWWEAASTTNLLKTQVGCLGGAWNYGTSDSIAGTIPARIASLNVKGDSASYNLIEAWFGFRTDRFGPRSEFVPVWDLGLSGANTYNDGSRTADSVDAPAYGDYKVRVATGPSDTSMVDRCGIKLITAVGNNNPYDQRGRFNVLLRARVTAGIWRVRLRDNFTGASNWRTQDRVKLDGATTTSYMLYSLGTVTIPPGARRVPLDNYDLRVQAEQVSGAGAIDFDCLVLIPTAEGAIYINDTSIQEGLYFVVVSVEPDGRMMAYTWSGANPNDIPDIAPEDWNMPVGAGTLYAAAQRSTAHDLDDLMEIRLGAYPRWRSLRGAA